MWKIINFLCGVDAVYYILFSMPHALSASLLLMTLICITAAFINGINDGINDGINYGTNNGDIKG